MRQINWLVTLSLLPLVAAVPLSEFYEFNTDKQCSILSGETVNDKLNKNCEEILFPRDINANILYHINSRFPFFDETVATVYANVNGFVSFNDGVEDSFPNLFTTSKHTVVSAFWNKIDITESNSGNVYFRPSTRHMDLTKASKEIRDVYSDQHGFEASLVLVVTWYKVTHYSQGSKHNIFQTVLITDGEHSFAINNYEDNGIQWSSVLPNGTGDGLDGTPAQAGYNDGTGLNYFVVPGSNTPDILSIASTSNVDIPGLWIFRLTYPSLKLKPYNLILKVGDEVLFDCTPSDKRSKIKWLKDDHVISEDDKRIKYFPNSSLKHILQIGSSNYSDNGTYTCGLDVAGKLISPQTSDVSVLKSAVNVYKVDDAQVVSNAIINNFIITHAHSRKVRQTNTGSGSGSAMGDSVSSPGDLSIGKRSADIDRSMYTTGSISLVGITTNGNEGITWNSKIISGGAIIDYNPGTDYVGAVDVTLTDKECTVLLNCSSTKGQEYSCITLTTEKPYLKSLNGSLLTVKEGSSPKLDFMVAVESDGIVEQHPAVQRYLTFSFTNTKLVTTYLPLPNADPDNFQHYSYTLPLVDSSWVGTYTLAFNDYQYGQAAASLILEVES